MKRTVYFTSIIVSIFFSITLLAQEQNGISTSDTLRKLRSSNYQERLEAAKRITEVTWTKLEESKLVFVDLLQEDDMSIKKYITKAIGYSAEELRTIKIRENTIKVIGEDDYYPQLSKLYGNENIESLLITIPYIVNNLKNTTDEELKIISLKALVFLDPSQYNNFISFLNDSSEELRKVAVGLFGFRGPKYLIEGMADPIPTEVIQMFKERLTVETSNKVKEEIYNVFGRTSTRDSLVLDILISGLKESYVPSALAAMNSLQMYRDASVAKAIPFIETFLLREDLTTRDRETALGDLNAIKLTLQRISETETPVITSFSANTKIIYPLTGKLKKILIEYKAFNSSGDIPQCSLSVKSSEKVKGKNFGNTSPDWKIMSTHSVFLRAESYKKQRKYTVKVICINKSKKMATDQLIIVARRKRK